LAKAPSAFLFNAFLGLAAGLLLCPASSTFASAASSSSPKGSCTHIARHKEFMPRASLDRHLLPLLSWQPLKHPNEELSFDCLSLSLFLLTTPNPNPEALILIKFIEDMGGTVHTCESE